MESFYRGVTRQRSRATKQKGCTAGESDNSESYCVMVVQQGTRAAAQPYSSRMVQQQSRATKELGSKGVLPQENSAVLHTRRIAGMQQGNRAAGHMCSNGVVQEREAASKMKACSSRDM